MVWDRRIPPDTRLAGSTPCLIVGVHRDQHFALDLAALIRGFRTPAPCGTVGAGSRGRRSKASQGGNRGEVGGRFGGRALWGFEDRGRLAMRGVRRPVTRSRSCGRDGGVGRFGWRRCAGARRWPRSRRTGDAREGIALVFRRAAGGGGDRRVRGGMRGDGHEVSILIRLGDGDRAGRGPSKVSTMIIRPPQHGQRRAGGTSSASTVGLGAQGWGALRRGEQLAGALDVVRPNRAGEEAVMADAVEAARQHVQEKAADELVRRQASWS